MNGQVYLYIYRDENKMVFDDDNQLGRPAVKSTGNATLSPPPPRSCILCTGLQISPFPEG